MQFLKHLTRFKSVNTSAIIIASFAVLSKILGLFRYSLIASKFGTTAVADAYMAAFRIPDFIYNALILGALSTAIIPVFLDLYNKRSSQSKAQDLGVEQTEEGMASVNIDSQQVVRALTEDDISEPKQTQTSKLAPHFELINAVLNTLLISLVVISIIAWIFTPQLVNFLMPGFGQERTALTIIFTRIMLLSPILFAVSNILGTILQSFKNFVWFGLAPVVYNIGIILGILILYPILGPKGLAWGVVLGASFHLLVQLPAVLKTGFAWRALMPKQVQAVHRVVKLVLPRALSLSANQINHIVNTALASTLAGGSVVVFYNAYDLEALPISLLAVSLAVASFPILSDCFACHQDSQFKQVLISVIKKIVFVMIPLSLFMILLRAQIVRLILGYGQYNWTDTVRTLEVFGVLSSSLVAQSLIPILARGFYARENTKIPVMISLAAISLNILLALIFVQKYDLLGLALAFSISSALHCTALWIALHRFIKGCITRRLIRSILAYTIAALIGGVGLYITLYFINSIFGSITRVWSLALQASLAFLVGTIMYLTFLYIIGDHLAKKVVPKIFCFCNKIRLIASK